MCGVTWVRQCAIQMIGPRLPLYTVGAILGQAPTFRIEFQEEYVS